MLDHGVLFKVHQEDYIMVVAGFNFLGHATIMQLDKL
jgi:hypothetical protein